MHQGSYLTKRRPCDMIRILKSSTRSWRGMGEAWKLDTALTKHRWDLTWGGHNTDEAWHGNSGDKAWYTNNQHIQKIDVYRTQSRVGPSLESMETPQKFATYLLHGSYSLYESTYDKHLSEYKILMSRAWYRICCTSCCGAGGSMGGAESYGNPWRVGTLLQLTSSSSTWSKTIPHSFWHPWTAKQPWDLGHYATSRGPGRQRGRTGALSRSWATLAARRFEINLIVSMAALVTFKI